MSKRLPNLAPPFAKKRKKIADYFFRLSEKFSLRQKFWFGFAVLSLLTTILIYNPFWQSCE